MSSAPSPESPSAEAKPADVVSPDVAAAGGGEEGAGEARARRWSLITGVTIVCILFALCFSWWWMQREGESVFRSANQSETVGDAVNSLSGDSANGAGQKFTTGNPTGPINDLLESLGLPEAAFSRGDAGETKAKFVERYQLEQALARAVSAGTIDHFEAAAVLKAYDSGLVSPVGGTIVLEDQARVSTAPAAATLGARSDD